MTKYKTTMKQQKQNNSIIISAGYCDLQYITKYLTAEAYTSGVYGWNSDIFGLADNIVLSTGYNPLNTWGYNKTLKNRAVFIGDELKKLNKKLFENKIKLSNDFNKDKKKILKMISKIIDKASEKFN